jgi:malonyl-CoA/methylmalonyl-CoA synthetase
MIPNLFSTFAWDGPAGRERPLLTTQTGTTYSYADAWRESARIANYLTATGLQPGDRITVQAPKSPRAVWLYLACLRAGFIYHPLNDAYQPAELEFFIDDAEPGTVVCDPHRVDIFAGLVAGRDCRLLTMDEAGDGSLADGAAGAADEFRTLDCERDTVAVLLYSSGTTGQPKGAMLTHGNLAANTAALVGVWGFSADDRLLHALPIYHAHGLFVGLGCVMMSGCEMTFLPKFDVHEVIRCLPGTTVMMGIPTFYSRLLTESDFGPESCRSIRLFISGSAPLPAEMHARFQQRSGHAILERYGMTETSMLSSNPLDGERRPGTVGTPLPGVTIRIVDETGLPVESGEVGEIQVSGPNVFKGYWRLEERTAAEFTPDGFFRTGDQGAFSHDGYLTIMGRNKDMIISGGLNVYPREVEQAIDRLDGVIESAVIGIPHADFGEAVIAVVAVEPGFETAEQDMIATLRERLASFKSPKRLFFVPQLPRNTMGKVQKNTLRQQYEQALS